MMTRTVAERSISRRGTLTGGMGVALTALLAACGGSKAVSTAAPAPTAVPAPTTAATAGLASVVGGPLDFKIVAYQGDDLLGGHETSFAKVFAQGKPVVLNFWAPLCPPCKDEMPALQEFADQFAGKIVFVGVDMGTFIKLGDHAMAQQFLADKRIRYPIAYATDPVVLQRYKILALPSNVYFTAKGDESGVTGVVSAGEQFQTVLNRLVASA